MKRLSRIEEARCLKVNFMLLRVIFCNWLWYSVLRNLVDLQGYQLFEALRCKPEGCGSIPDGVIGIFHLHNPSDRTMALGLTQPLTEMSTRNISCG